MFRLCSLSDWTLQVIGLADRVELEAAIWVSLARRRRDRFLTGGDAGDLDAVAASGSRERVLPPLVVVNRVIGPERVSQFLFSVVVSVKAATVHVGSSGHHDLFFFDRDDPPHHRDHPAA
jgi:hypothetical protein